MEDKNVRIIENPVIFINLCKMRDKNTDSQGVRIATRKITRVLLYEAAKNLPLVEKEIETPVVKTKVKTVEDDINIKLFWVWCFHWNFIIVPNRFQSFFIPIHSNMTNCCLRKNVNCFISKNQSSS